MHSSTFEYLKPTDEQIEVMAKGRKATAEYVAVLEEILPLGPDRTYVIRKVREAAMWINVAITRTEDGTPRK